MTIKEIQEKMETLFQEISTTPTQDAHFLLEEVLQKNTAFFYTYPEYTLNQKHCARIEKMISERLQGVPVAYITKKKDFFGREFFVDERVLIPRRETELIIEKIINEFKNHPSPLIVDIGTGSGCIAITLKKEIPQSTIIATDISFDALFVAKKNAQIHQTEIEFFQGDLYDALPQRYEKKIDCIVSNPPYVPASHVDSEKTAETIGLQYEPRGALVPQQNNQDAEAHIFIERLLQKAHKWKKENGMIIIEIGHDQADIAKKSALHYFSNASIEIEKDLAHNDRILLIH